MAHPKRKAMTRQTRTRGKGGTSDVRSTSSLSLSSKCLFFWRHCSLLALVLLSSYYAPVCHAAPLLYGDCNRQHQCGSSRWFSWWPKLTMCHPGRNRQVCTLFPRLRQQLGFVCGPCSSTFACDPTQAFAVVPIDSYTPPTELVLPIVGQGHSEINRESLCELWWVSNDPTSPRRVPIAKSYQGHDWEVMAGWYATKQVRFRCNDTDCVTHLPMETPRPPGRNPESSLRTHDRYELVSWTRDIHQNPIQQSIRASRFLEQTTFGPTRWELNDFTDPVSWIQTQMQDIPPTYHRSYYRQRWNHRFEHAAPHGITSHPCQVGTRYRKYAFSDKDRNDHVQVETINSTAKLLSVDGNRRTLLMTSKLTAGRASGPEFNDGVYQMCRKIDNFVGTAFKLMRNNGCHTVFADGSKLGVPPVLFDNDVTPDREVLQLDDTNVLEWDNDFYESHTPQELLVVQTLNQSVCQDIPHAIAYDVYTVIGQYRDEYYIHDARYVLWDNTLEHPLPDGGGQWVDATADVSDPRFRVECASVEPTFLNEHHCQLASSDGSNACSSGDALSTETVELSVANFQRAFVASQGHRVIYSVEHLRQLDVNGTVVVSYDAPCTPGVTSRWARLDENVECENTPLGENTVQVFQNLLSNSTGNADSMVVRDVLFPTLGFACDSNNTALYDMVVPVDGQCWKNTHRSNYQVFDFTEWVTAHPGGEAAILQFALADNFTLSFPSWHEMSRWNDNVQAYDVIELGRLGSVVAVADSPDIQESFQEILLDEELEGTTLVCGSPQETANDHQLGGSMYRGAFDAMTSYNRTTGTADLERQRTSIWLEIAMKAPDQLRQKVAWILSQILVVSPSAIELWFQTELFVNYYDIFVRNAFGNYGDILKEVAYSPVMSEMLTFHNGHSTAYVWDRFRRLEYADENFAREIMQLFSIGLVELNDDGTVAGGDGSERFTYSNEDISEYARLWTGLVRQPRRGNIEDYVRAGRNQIDPMRINMQVKDYFPKMGINGVYVGDHLPLCSDLPRYHFLNEGAVYRMLGTLPTPRLLSEPSNWVNDHFIKRLRLSASSHLFSAICNSANISACDYQAVVVLNQTLDCTGNECAVDSPRIIEVEAGLYYEYARPACVEQAFYNDAMLLKSKENRHFCGDPSLQIGGVACCEGSSPSADIGLSEFDGERVTMSVASDKCTANLLGLCSNPDWACDGCDTRLGYWTEQSCNTMVKIDLEGRIAIVHRADGVSDRHMVHTVREDTKSFFRADWTGPIDEMLESYEDSCESMGCERDSSDNLCLCTTTINQAPAFYSAPTRQQVLDQLKIGASPPSLYKNLTMYDVGGGVIMHAESLTFTETVIFEVVDDNGFTTYRKNLHSTVMVGNGALSLSFRNPPHFISLSYPEKRDAIYEIESGLQHFLYHRNTAPFLAHKFLQRLGSANPSPRLVQSAASAFRSGRYEFVDDIGGGSTHVFGSGEYGDLSAMIAAILLDRESQSFVLDYDPTKGSVLEPFLLFVRVLRSLEFVADDDDPHIRLEPDLQELIGQQCHKLPSVFSFFLPEYSPAGPIGEAWLTCPECQTMTGPKAIALSNGLNSLLKYGLDSAYGGFGFGRGGAENRRSVGDTSRFSTGHLTYESTSSISSSADVVDELSILLTAGRLLEEKRSQLISLYDELMASHSARNALIHLQQVILTTPEFHSNTIARNSDQIIPDETDSSGGTPRSSGDYKAVIQILLVGGFDSHNMLVPHECTGTNADGATVRQQYDSERGVLAFSNNERSVRINVDAGNQPCTQFALHDELSLFKELYDDGDLTFFANTGMLEEAGVGRSDYRQRTSHMQLFAHNGMQYETQAVDPFSESTGTGVLGRLASRLQSKGYPTSAVSLDDPSTSTQPEMGVPPEPIILSRQGVTTFDRRPSEETFDLHTMVEAVNGRPRSYSSLFGQTWSDKFVRGIRQAEFLQAFLDDTSLGNHWPSMLPGYGLQYEVISKMIQSRDAREKRRELFFASFAGWDHHADMKENLRIRFEELNEGLGWLVEELKLQGVWDDVAIVITSDFGRTLTSNSNAGSDHAWGGNYVMMGGSVKGGQVLGQYPSDITRKGPLNIGRGRIIPTTSWDAVWNGVAEWMGADSEEDLQYCLPNRNKSTGDGFTDPFSRDDLFV